MQPGRCIAFLPVDLSVLQVKVFKLNYGSPARGDTPDDHKNLLDNRARLTIMPITRFGS